MASSTAASEAGMSSRTDRMRESTRRVHDHSTGQVKLGLILASKPLYTETLALFLPIYKYLEDALERNKDDPFLGQLYPLLELELARAPGFQQDIEYYTNKSIDSPLPQLVKEYILYLESVEKTNPVALLAWYYHLYMAIFGGGFIIKRTVTKTMKLSSEQGVKAFSFGETNPKTLRTKFKEIINSMELTPQQEELIIQEGPKVFARNDELMANLREGETFKNAEADCCRFITKVIAGVLMALFAVGVAFTMQSST